MNINAKLNDFRWSVISRPSTAQMVKNGNFTSVPPEIFATPVPAGSIALLWSSGEIFLTTPFGGGTFRDWCTALYTGLRKQINYRGLSPAALKKIHQIIFSFLDRKHRGRLLGLLTSNRLKGTDLVGEQHFFKGGLTLSGGVWTYSLGS